MKRFHVHGAVDHLKDSIRFYSSLFGVTPTAMQPTRRFALTIWQGLWWHNCFGRRRCCFAGYCPHQE